MPSLRKPVPILAAISDIHLSHKPPIARSNEEDWYKVQKGYFKQVHKIVTKHNIPLVIAGDLFDDGWRASKCPPSLINLAIGCLTGMAVYGIPGQHDLEHHRLDAIKRSAFWTLVEAGRIINLPEMDPIRIGELALWGYPWSTEVQPCPDPPHDLIINIAVIHHYIWQSGCLHPQADAKDHLKKWGSRLKGYDVAVFGDNHIPWSHNHRQIVNCGTFMRRKRDEKHLTPSVWLVHNDASIKQVPLDVSQDKWLEDSEVGKASNEIDAQALMKELSELSDASIDFGVALRNALDKKDATEQVRKIVLDALGG